MNNFFINEINRVMASTIDKGLTPELASVIFSLGRDSECDEEYDFALSKLMELYERDNEDVKAQVIQAFAMLAVLKKDIKMLDRSLIEPLILKAAATASDKNKYIILDAIEDINHSLGWNLFCHYDTSDEHISLHDCIASRAYFKDGKLGFELDNGFWVLPTHPESGLNETARTDKSLVEYDLEDGEEYDVTIYVFENYKSDKTERKEIPLGRFVDELNAGKYSLEFLYQYLGFGARIIECELIFDTVPYRKECIIKICYDEVRYCWGNLRCDVTW